jgi:tetratricopeptide (TPR) repeat protein
MIWRALSGLLVPACLAGAAEGSIALMGVGIQQFNAAYEKWDAAGFATAAETFQRACASAPGSSTNYYWLGAAEFHRMLQVRSLPSSTINTLAAGAAMNAARRALEIAVDLDERHAESHALLGTLYGMKIDGNLLRAARFGPRVARHQKRALASGARNPRVLYLLGTCQFHTAMKPSAQREALETFLSAEKLFAAEARRPAGPLEPRWGRSTCLTFTGRTYERLGQRAEAVVYFQRALAEHPADFVARDGLARVTETQSK